VLKQFKLRAIVLIFALGVILSFSPRVWSRSDRFNERIHAQQVKNFHPETLSKDGALFMHLNNQGKEFFYLAGNHRNNYQNLSPEEKARLKRKFHKWQSLPNERQKMLRRRMERWNQLPPAERRLFQHRYQQWQNLSPADRKRIREKLQHWDRLSPDEQKEILRKFYRHSG